MYWLRNKTFRRGITGLALFMVAVAGYQVREPRSVSASQTGYSRSQNIYQIPELVLKDSQGSPVSLRELLSEQRPVLVQFIFTSCQTVCPLLTATMAQAQADLRQLRSDTRIVSISIDPERDTPDRLARYAEQFGAKGDWTFLTGNRRQVRQVLNAFDAVYSGGNKMNHKPYTFVRRPRDETWLRLVGNLGAGRLVQEYRDFLTGASTDDA